MTANHCDRLLDYFNDQLTDEQKAEFEAHLLECEDCRMELAELEQLTEVLPYSSEPVDPPSGMKERVLSNVIGEKADDVHEEENVVPVPESRNEPAKKRRGWYKPLMAAVLTLSLVGNGAAVIYITNNEQTTEPAPEPEGGVSLDTLETMRTLQPSEGVNAQATAMMISQNDQTNLVVQANGLEELEGEETYQVWVLEGEQPYRAGTFVPNEDGDGGVSYVMDYEGEQNFDTIAITKEPDANSQTPQGDILLSSSL
ncbi:anti-sigma factor [Lentibacillus jeotgali]|uniref:anti-sigma factor n=1 Tax=Lentibacillus jeotgali TaxID=558169 RepID=UPI0002627C04|nr:anti-sigma factor [Lentibacillus jeotgali]